MHCSYCPNPSPPPPPAHVPQKQVLKEAVRLAKEACLASEPMQFTSSDPPLVDQSMARDAITVHYPLARVLSGGVGGVACA